MAIFKIKRFSRFTKLELEDLKLSLPSEYKPLQMMNLDPSLKMQAKKASYLKKEGEFPYFELIPLEEHRKENYQSDWKLPIIQIDSLGTPVYFNFKKGYWENFQGLPIKDLKSYLWNNWNDSMMDWEKGEFEDYLDEKDNTQFYEYTRTLLKATKRYL